MDFNAHIRVCVSRPSWTDYIRPRSLGRGHETNSRRARRRSVLEEQTHSSHLISSHPIHPSVSRASLQGPHWPLVDVYGWFQMEFGDELFLSFRQGACSTLKKLSKWKASNISLVFFCSSLFKTTCASHCKMTTQGQRNLLCHLYCFWAVNYEKSTWYEIGFKVVYSYAWCLINLVALRFHFICVWGVFSWKRVHDHEFHTGFSSGCAAQRRRRVLCRGLRTSRA